MSIIHKTLPIWQPAEFGVFTLFENAKPKVLVCTACNPLEPCFYPPASTYLPANPRPLLPLPLLLLAHASAPTSLFQLDSFTSAPLCSTPPLLQHPLLQFLPSMIRRFALPSCNPFPSVLMQKKHPPSARVLVLHMSPLPTPSPHLPNTPTKNPHTHPPCSMPCPCPLLALPAHSPAQPLCSPLTCPLGLPPAHPHVFPLVQDALWPAVLMEDEEGKAALKELYSKSAPASTCIRANLFSSSSLVAA